MQTFFTVADLRAQIQAWRAAGLKIALVPTMGNLHLGHLSLLEIAKQKADKVVASIFVNPLQFGVGEDFDSYPRTLEQDQQKLAEIGCDALFAPNAQEVYPNGQPETLVTASKPLTSLLEGASRPGHFDGVCTVVAKLFNLVQPDVAIFGQKDYQQWLVLQAMVADLNFPIEMICAPIGRAENGLALSSRNQYLTAEQLEIAPKLYVVLQNIRLAIESGNQDLAALCEAAKQQLIFEGFDAVDYISVHDKTTLEEVVALAETDSPQPDLVVLAVARLGRTRLLDNLMVCFG